MITGRGLLVAVLVLVPLAGCSQGLSQQDRLATAKWYVPLVDQLKPTSEQGVDRSDIEVRDLGKSRREVTGSATVSPGGSNWSFVCVVTPDATDKPRGLRVEGLDVHSEDP